MKLSRYNLRNIDSARVVVPDNGIFDLPETVLQFGTGVLLRGLPGYFIDKANRGGVFNGRMVVVKSTEGDTSVFDTQDCLYTQCVRGIENDQTVEENIINSSISRVLDAKTEWQQVLECAHNVQLKIIISNTTEAGIELINEDIRKHPPTSFPGKLLAVLYERFRAFDGSDQSGMIIIPTELIADNGHQLEAIVLELAHLNGLEDNFIEWLEANNHFCNSLVDRIVPGSPAGAFRTKLESSLGYQDDLLIVSESYRLWAIEGDDYIQSVLSFAEMDSQVIIARDISMYKELKLHLLNGTHTLTCAVAYLDGMNTVGEAMKNPLISSYITGLMKDEIAVSTPTDFSVSSTSEFSNKVLDRFSNPYIDHHWLDIAVQYTLKMKSRNIILLLNYYKRRHMAPHHIAFGFAAYILFMRSTKQEGARFIGSHDGREYIIQDDKAHILSRHWKKLNIPDVVTAVLRDNLLWNTNLSSLPGFTDLVTTYLLKIVSVGIQGALRELKPVLQ